MWVVNTVRQRRQVEKPSEWSGTKLEDYCLRPVASSSLPCYLEARGFTLCFEFEGLSAKEEEFR